MASSDPCSLQPASAVPQGTARPSASRPATGRRTNSACIHHGKCRVASTIDDYRIYYNTNYKLKRQELLQRLKMTRAVEAQLTKAIQVCDAALAAGPSAPLPKL